MVAGVLAGVDFTGSDGILDLVDKTRRWKVTGSVILLMCWSCACVGPVVEKIDGNDKNVTAKVFVVHDNWHSAILIRTADLAPNILPEMRDFPGAEYLEFSWGDRDYFPHPDPGVGLALKAAFWSSGSIIHVVGVSDSPAIAYPNAEIITIGLPAAGFQRLTRFVAETFSRSDPQSASEARPGLSENARFYLAQGRFTVLRTCNTWVAEALQAAELPITPRWVITAASLGRQARALGITHRTAMPQ